MLPMLKKAVSIRRNEGSISLAKRSVQFGYDNYVRPQLPRRVVLYNDVPVHAAFLGDSIIPWHRTDDQGYEAALVCGIRTYVEKGDTVVVVGGGWGVSTVSAARQTGDEGKVITYEGGKQTVKKVRDSVQLNDVNRRVSVHHGIVGTAISLRDVGCDAEAVSPSELPECDVLVLDCEGAEREILDKMEIRPRAIIVETHGVFDSSTNIIEEILLRNSYEIHSKRHADYRKRDFCEENDICVLASVLESQQNI